MRPRFDLKRACAALPIVCGTALAASCTGSPSAQGSAQAAALCQRVADPKQHLVASYPTTVGEVRTWTIGPGNQPAAAWSRYSQNDFAAWCWLDTTGGDTRTVIAASPGKEPIGFVTGDSGALQPNPQGPAAP